MVNYIKMKSPKIDDNLPMIYYEDIYLKDEPSLENGHIEGAFVVEDRQDNLMLSRIKFTSIRILQSTFEKADLMDIHF